MVAHSAGGSCAESVWRKFKHDSDKKLKALVLTDSWFSVNDGDEDFFQEIGIHYVASYEKLGEKIGNYHSPILHVSAGTDDHVYTTGVSTPSLCKFIKEKF